MSLINDALKRAQRQRAAEEAGIAPPTPGGRVIKRGKPLSAQSLLLIVVGAAVLIVLSVVATVYLVQDAPKPAATSAAANPNSLGIQKAVVNEPAPSLVVFVPSPSPESAPVIKPPEINSRLTSAQLDSPIAGTPATLPAPLPASPAPAVAPSPARPAVAEPVPHDERVNFFLDKLHVTGIRSSGNESKVLMNDRVYRVNDIVDRTLGLRLQKVEPGILTFVDERGATYTKHL